MLGYVFIILVAVFCHEKPKTNNPKGDAIK